MEFEFGNNNSIGTFSLLVNLGYLHRADNRIARTRQLRITLSLYFFAAIILDFHLSIYPDRLGGIHPPQKAFWE